MTVRLARPSDLPLIPEIERAAGELFRTAGMDSVADDVLPTVEELAVPQRMGRLWVAEEQGDVVGYLALEMVDDAAHIEQVSVLSSHARRGIGRQLIDAVNDWAAARGMRALSLTTFSTCRGTGRTTGASASANSPPPSRDRRCAASVSTRPPVAWTAGRGWRCGARSGLSRPAIFAGVTPAL